jgi:hypothetical protein
MASKTIPQISAAETILARQGGYLDKYIEIRKVLKMMDQEIDAPRAIKDYALYKALWKKFGPFIYSVTSIKC